MDNREKIVRNVAMALSAEMDTELIQMVQDVLVMELSEYEVQERCTDIVKVETGGEKMMQRYVATKRIEGLSENTIRRYIDVNMKLLNFLGKPINEITTYDVRFYLSYKKEKDKVKKSTLDGMRRCFNAFYSWLAAENLIDRNPCQALAQIKCKNEIRKPFSAIELEKLKSACKTKRDLALVEFLYSTGCRVSEVSALNRSDINFEELEIKVLGKGDKERIVYLTPVAAMRLQEYLDARIDNDPCLFYSRAKRRFGKNGIEALIRKLGKSAGIEKAHPHRFRRTLATNLLDRGMDIQDVAAILGHADLKTTKIYCYTSQSKVKREYRKYSL